MLKTRFFVISGVVATIVLMFLGGCAGKSQPARFYTLAAKSQERLVPAVEGSGQSMAIGIGPVRIADYLDQSRIVTRTGENRINQAEFDQWSGSFKDNLGNVLAENIGFLLATDRVSIYPWRSYTPVDYQVAVDVVRCDGELGKEVALVARWSVLGNNEKNLFAMKRSDILESTEGDGYEALVEAQSRAIARLSQDIAEAIWAANRRGQQTAQ